MGRAEEEWDGKCQQCRYFDSDDEAYPCCSCKGTAAPNSNEYIKRPVLFEKRTPQVNPTYVKKTNIVQVVLLEDNCRYRYNFMVPVLVELKKDDVVIVQTQDGKEKPARCVTDSEMLSDNAIEMLMSGKKVISKVVGIYEKVRFDK